MIWPPPAQQQPQPEAPTEAKPSAPGAGPEAGAAAAGAPPQPPLPPLPLGSTCLYDLRSWAAHVGAHGACAPSHAADAAPPHAPAAHHRARGGGGGGSGKAEAPPAPPPLQALLDRLSAGDEADPRRHDVSAQPGGVDLGHQRRRKGHTAVPNTTAPLAAPQECAPTPRPRSPPFPSPRQRSLMDELRRRAALLGGGAPLAGRRCFLLDASEAAAQWLEGRSGGSGGGGGPEEPGGGGAMPEAAWVAAAVAGWSEQEQLLTVRPVGLAGRHARHFRWQRSRGAT
jgi:hypothetical protein